jgi:hypothetical protein
MDGGIYSNGIGSFLRVFCDRDRDCDLDVDRRGGGASSSSNRRSCLESLLGLGLVRGFDRPLECADSGLSVALERIVLERVEAGLSSSFGRIILAWADLDSVGPGLSLALALVLECVEAGVALAFRRAILACVERECVEPGVGLSAPVLECGDAPCTVLECEGPGSLDSLLGVVGGFLDLEVDLAFEVLGVGGVVLVASLAPSSFALIPGASFGSFFLIVWSSALIPGASRLFLSLLTAFLSLDPSRGCFPFKIRILLYVDYLDIL